MKAEAPKFICVGGCGRSGTTLVQKILLNHPQISGGPEFGYTAQIMDLYATMSNSQSNGWLDSHLSKSDFQ